jgi:hypothetical protein
VDIASAALLEDGSSGQTPLHSSSSSWIAVILDTSLQLKCMHTSEFGNYVQVQFHEMTGTSHAIHGLHSVKHRPGVT